MPAVIRLGRKNLVCTVPFFCLIAGFFVLRLHPVVYLTGMCEYKHSCTCFPGNVKFID